MPLVVDLARLSAALAGVPGLAGWRDGALQPMIGGGVAHDHVRIVGTGLVARVPRLSQFALAAAQNLAYQAECFRRLGASGRVPRLAAVLPPGAGLPMGALLVEEIAGRPVRLPGDLPAIAATLAAIHDLPLPQERAPLGDHPDPVGGTWAVVREQARFFATAPATPAVQAALAEEIAWAEAFAASAGGRPQPRTLVATDTHPGNFVIEDAGGRAIFVDAEKALYGAPAIDAAHVTLATSVLWSAPDAVPVAAEAVVAFERAWLGRLRPELASAVRPWVRPLRRLTWLRSMSWFARWWTLSRDDPAWSAAMLDPALAAHIQGRVRQFFTAGMVERVRQEWLGPDPLPEP